MINQFVPSQFCLNKCRFCCRFSQRQSIFSPALLDEEIRVFAENSLLLTLVSADKKICLLPMFEHYDPALPKACSPIFVCPFLDLQDSKCKAYKLRPLECQLYPFLLNRRENKGFLALDLGCPFVKEKINSPEFADYANYLFTFLNSHEQLKLLRANPQIIQVYPEAKDLRELEF